MLKKYIDNNYIVYKNLDFSNDSNNIKKKINIKDVLKLNPKFLIIKDKEVIYQKENIQTLYLYPLSLLDYVDNLTSENIISINLINIDPNEDYIKIFCSKIFQNLKSVEILIDNNYDDKQYSKVFELVNYFYKRNVKISLNIKNLINIPNKIFKCFKFVSYFKIFLPNILNTDLYNLFLEKLYCIGNNISNTSLLHIKAYLNIKQVNYYEQALNDFSKCNVDIFQVSKELLPIGIDNENVDINIQKKIRNLENKYYSYDTIKFISVKDISTLYYLRFELDDRNSKKCFACKMKPYLFNKKILPCKVQMIFENLELWASDYNNIKKYKDVVKKCGISCSDCASIFENDILYDVEKVLKKEKCEDIKFCLQIDD